MTDLTPDSLDEEETTKPIVEWFDDSPWRVQFVPTAAAFGAGVAVGVLGALLLLKLARD
jgi:hypothetical protein